MRKQIQFFMEPFHRMFILSNTAIQYPHALVERVPICAIFIVCLEL
jgi:diacylglycerol diphosphate phosphatase/phosphatidate phosphatase